MTVLPQTIEQFRNLLSREGADNLHELVFLAHAKGCDALEFLFARFPHWNGFQEHDPGRWDGRWRVISPTEVRFTPAEMFQEHLQEEVFELSSWMQVFLRIFKGFTFLEDPTEWATETSYSWDEGWGEMRASGSTEINVGYFKYNRVSWIDCITILDWIERGEEPIMFPSPFIAARLLPRKGPHKLFVNRKSIRIYPVEVAKYDRGFSGVGDINPKTRVFLKGAEYSGSPIAQTDSLPSDFEFKKRDVSMGCRIEIDEPGVETVFSYLWSAAMEDKGITFCYFTYWPSQGLILLEYPPEKVAELLRMELSSVAPFTQGRQVPLIWDSLEPIEKLLQAETKERGRRELANWHLQVELGIRLYTIDFGREVELTVEYRSPMHWMKSVGSGTNGRWLSELFENAHELELLPGTIEEFAALAWRAIPDHYSPPRFNHPLRVELDDGDELLVVEEATGFEYVARPVVADSPGWNRARLEGKEGEFVLTYCEKKDK